MFFSVPSGRLGSRGDQGRWLSLRVPCQRLQHNTRMGAISQMPRTKQQKMTPHAVSEAVTITINNLPLLDLTGQQDTGTRDECGTFAQTHKSQTDGRLDGLLWKMSAFPAALQQDLTAIPAAPQLMQWVAEEAHSFQRHPLGNCSSMSADLVTRKPHKHFA